MTMTQRLMRGLLLLGVILLCLWLVAAHGFRGIVIVSGVVVLVSVVQTRVFRALGGALVRFTGSRRRAVALVMGVVLAAMVAVSVIEALR